MLRLRKLFAVTALAGCTYAAGSVPGVYAGNGDFHYIGPNGKPTCINVSFPQHNWFNSQRGMLNTFGVGWAENLASTNHLFYVGYVRTGQVDVAGTAPGYEYSTMYVGGPALNPWDNTTTVGSEGTYYRIDSYMLYFGSCPVRQPGQPNCPKYVVLGSRGSGTDPGSKDWAGGLGVPGQKFVAALRARLGKDQVSSAYNHYPAVGVIASIKEIATALSLSPAGIAAAAKAVRQVLNGLGALTRTKHLGAYYDSVMDGETELLRMVQIQTASACAASGTRVILVGYSQGAQVTGDVYQSLDPGEARYVAGVVLFGDPKYNPGDTSDHFGLNDPNSKVRWTKNQGVLNKRLPFNSPNVWSFCHRGDPVCQGLGQWPHKGTHMRYGDYNEPQLAAQYFAG